MTDEKKKILVVEDDIFISDIYQVKFSQEGFQVAVAVNGLEALKILDNFRPDIILLDIIMPQMDGIETLKKLKNDEKWKNIPIIMLTNISEKEKVEESEEMGVNDYLVKSQFTPSEVVEKVNALLNR